LDRPPSRSPLFPYTTLFRSARFGHTHSHHPLTRHHPPGIGSKNKLMAAKPYILITGGAGFIGSHLVERVLANGKAVTVIDDCSRSEEHTSELQSRSDLVCRL